MTMPMNRWAVFANMDRHTLRSRIKSKFTKKEDWFIGTEIEELRNITKKMVDIKLRVNKICGVCERKMKNRKNNAQSFCVYSPAQKKRYNRKETPCQKTARIARMRKWRKSHKTGEKKIVVDYKTTRRKCLSTLSNPEEHWFDSRGKTNRICDECHENDLVNRYFNRPRNKVVI